MNYLCDQSRNKWHDTCQNRNKFACCEGCIQMSDLGWILPNFNHSHAGWFLLYGLFAELRAVGCTDGSYLTETSVYHWILTFMWMPANTNHPPEHPCRPSELPHGWDTPWWYWSLEERCVLPHPKHCSATWPGALAVHLASKHPRSKSYWALFFKFLF